MNWDDGTGGGNQPEHRTTAQVPLPPGSISGDRLPRGLDTPGSGSTGETKRGFAAEPATRFAGSLRHASERALRKRRHILKACRDDLERARNNGDDLILKGNALADVKSHLEALWKLLEGEPGAQAFEEMINVLQIVFCIESPADLTSSQLDTLESVLAQMHDDPDVDDPTANDLTQELIRGGIDVFREIG